MPAEKLETNDYSGEGQKGGDINKHLYILRDDLYYLKLKGNSLHTCSYSNSLSRMQPWGKLKEMGRGGIFSCRAHAAQAAVEYTVGCY